MRTNWVPLSASALVTGAMCLVLGSAMNPAEVGSTAGQTVQVASHESARWLAMAVMYSLASITLVLGLPTVTSLVTERGTRLGLAGAAVLSVGAIGTGAYAMLLVYFRALVVADAVDNSAVGIVAEDAGVRAFLAVWIGAFYLGILLVAGSLLVAGTTARWVPVLFLAFVVLAPVTPHLGRVAGTLQAMMLAVALTGAATAAVARQERAAPRHQPAY